MRVAARLFEASRPGADVLETHISTVAFDGDVVHKRKKDVRFPFIDLSTPERREAICRREVELNSRFSPDVYLGVEEVVDDDGIVVDHAVRMRRMPADRRLSTLVRGTADVDSCLRQIARLIAIAHAEAVTDAEISSVATTSALRQLWQQNLVELEPFVPEPLDRGSLAEIGNLADRYLAGRGRLVEDRIRRGCVVDGHGDLLADDIYCLDDGPRVLDCLEFDDRLRWGDVLYDVGFLAMDLERLGRPDLAERVHGLVSRVLGRDAPGVAGASLHRVSSAGALEDLVSARKQRRPRGGTCLPRAVRSSSAVRQDPTRPDRRTARVRQEHSRYGPRRRARLAGAAVGRAPEGTRGPRLSDISSSPVQGGAVLASDNRDDICRTLRSSEAPARGGPLHHHRRFVLALHHGASSRPPLHGRRSRNCSSCGARCRRASLPIASVNERPSEPTHRMPTRPSVGRWRASSTNGRVRRRSTRGRPARWSCHTSPNSSRPLYATDRLRD